jgi:hypothetical protein
MPEICEWVIEVVPLHKCHAIKICGGAEVQLHEFLTLALDRGEWLASHSGHITARERALWY